jgi:hypothetical protein
LERGVLEYRVLVGLGQSPVATAFIERQIHGVSPTRPHVDEDRAEIDHIAAPVGVFMVDAKRYQAMIEIHNGSWFLRPGPPRRRGFPCEPAAACDVSRLVRIQAVATCSSHALMPASTDI